MPSAAELVPAPLAAAFAARFAASRRAHERAARVLPDGVSGAVRAAAPFPVHVERAAGPYKWTVDGHRLIDYWMGHAALLLGHGAPEIQAALERQLARGLHFAAPHALEAELAERIVAMVPHVEQVRFTGTGSEASALAIRIARAATGRARLIRLRGHYHGWTDPLLPGVLPPYDRRPAGIGPGAAGEVAVLPPDRERIAEALAAGDVAAVLLEPSGGSAGALPLSPGLLAGLRELTSRAGAVLIFDEIITGFRFAPGGAAERYGVEPDLSTFSKALFGGMPGAAVGGRRDLMRRLALRAGGDVMHQGTWNGAPLAMAAGNACLARIADGAILRAMEATAQALRARLRDVLGELGVPGMVYGESSILHVALGVTPGSAGDGAALHAARLDPRVNASLRCALLLEGVDLFTSHGSPVSAAHGDAEIAATAAAFRAALERLRAAGALEGAS